MLQAIWKSQILQQNCNDCFCIYRSRDVHKEEETDIFKYDRTKKSTVDLDAAENYSCILRPKVKMRETLKPSCLMEERNLCKSGDGSVTVQRVQLK